MDLRIVNTCNNNCLYCLENSLRNKQNYISKDLIFSKILENKDKKNITFFGWNPLLHPDLQEIIIFCKNSWFSSIWILSNSFWINKDFLDLLIKNWLNSFGIYFNTFDKQKQKQLSWDWITYENLLKNLLILSDSKIFLKIIIHINKQNIDSLIKDILILSKKYSIYNYDFVNYFPFDKPYINRKNLEYNIKEKNQEINNLFAIIKKLNLKVNFVKFSRDFFWQNTQYYNFQKWILDQIWDEDIQRLSISWIPFCFKEKRCNTCFIKDKCKFYGL